jgi:hypothetical protein
MKGRESVPTAIGGNLVGKIGALLKVSTLLDHFDAKCAHRGVLFDAVVDRHEDGGGNSVLTRCESNGLSVISSRGRDDTGGPLLGAAKLVYVNEAAAHLEGTGGGVILVLDPD